MKLKATLQKDYYGKAKTRIENGSIILTSYNTDVCMIDRNGNFIRLWNGFSTTSAKHINDFRKQNGFTMLNKKEWLQLPCINPEEVYKVYMSTGFATHTGTALLTAAEAEKEVQRIKNNNNRLYAWYD